MRAALSFRLPLDAAEAEERLRRLEDLLALINADKEEQALDPERFAGNLRDYPEWLKESFGSPETRRAMERFCGCGLAELFDEWDLETWYESLFFCEAWDYRLRRPGPPGKAPGAITFQVEEEHYGGDVAHAWLLLALGARELRCAAPREEKGSAPGG
jgi:hypothetical protein